MQLTTRELVEKFGSHRLIVLDDDILADFDDDTVLLLSAQKPTKKSILPEIAKYANFLKNDVADDNENIDEQSKRIMAMLNADDKRIKAGL